LLAQLYQKAILHGIYMVYIWYISRDNEDVG
jgi:hypothetical protein